MPYPGGNIIRVTPTLDTSAYANNDVFFNATEIPNAVSSRGGVSKLHAISILNEDDTAHDFDLVLMQVQTDLGTINEAIGSGSLWTNALAKAAKVIGVIKIDWTDNNVDLVNNLVYTHSGGVGAADSSAGISLPMILNSEGGSTSIYVAGVSRGGTPTTAADDYEIAFHIEYLS